MELFDEDEIEYDKKGEVCPMCNEIGCLMDLELTEQIEIEYYTKNNYGVETEYIKNKEIAMVMEEITGRKTIRANDRYNLEKLGLKFVEVIKPKI
jgi:hypothetical protein